MSTADQDDVCLVLVENEVTTDGRYDFWRDITGVQYHYPNTYKGRVRPGRRFIYYRGAQRVAGRRGTPEYFGRGVIGEVWQDPETTGSTPHWYASIDDYEAFRVAVPARRNDGTTVETPKGNEGNRYFGIGVRLIPRTLYDVILAEAGIEPGLAASASIPLLPPEPAKLTPSSEAELLVRVTARRRGLQGIAGGRSPRAKVIGDQAEGLVFSMLQELGKQPRWLAQEGETPGWDIEYLEDGVRIVVEVKGATGERFTGIPITANEWRAAQQEGAQYHLYLVARCMSMEPTYEIIVNPAALVANGELLASPSEWVLQRNA